MTPRTDFDCMPTGAPVSEVAQCILETGHSRLPIYKDTRDNIIGIAYAKDLISLLVDPAKHHTAVDEIMRSPFFVPETKIVSELLQEFRSRKNHIAIAVDEYGGTSGLATIEDILEEIGGRHRRRARRAQGRGYPSSRGFALCAVRSRLP